MDRNLLGLDVIGGRVVVEGHPRLERMQSHDVLKKDVPAPFFVTRGARLLPTGGGEAR